MTHCELNIYNYSRQLMDKIQDDMVNGTFAIYSNHYQPVQYIVFLPFNSLHILIKCDKLSVMWIMILE